MRPPSPTRPLAFPTLDSLAAYLRPRLPGPALASWGSAPGTKNLLNLFLELSCGDCTLLPAASSPPALVVRAVHVATVRIRNRRGALLVETRQLLSDGTLRRRAARLLPRRCAWETPRPPRPRRLRGARYVLHAVDAELVEGVPEEGEFETEEAGEGEGHDGGGAAITVKRHYWSGRRRGGPRRGRPGRRRRCAVGIHCS
ncbi:hypothetical protein ZWY2020_010483 [Hordeum vulgare]|nr:hypothetical protein ZWY2020_010483 [Hordeum vulgare]